MAWIDTLRAAIMGTPPAADYKPSREGLVRAAEDLNITVNDLAKQTSMAASGIQTYATVASLPSPVPAAGTMARVYNDSTASNNVFWVVKGGVWVKDTAFEYAAAAAVQPLVDEAEAAADRAEAAVLGITGENTYTGTDIDSGSYGRNWNFSGRNVGDLAPSSPTNGTSASPIPFGILPRLAVTRGMAISVKTLGGTTGRGYALTDAAGVILVLAPATVNTLTNPWVYTATEDGWLYINCNTSSLASFEVSLEGVVVSLIDTSEALQAEVIDLESRVAELEGLTDQVSYDGTDIDSGAYGRNWNFSGRNVGDLAPEAPANGTSASPIPFGILPRIRIPSGVQVSVKTRGGANGRGYAVADAAGVILELAPQNVNTLTNPWVYTATQDSWLYINCNTDSLAFFSVDIVGVIPQVNQDISSLDARVTALENGGVSASLKVLLLTNSYGADSTEYLPEFLNASGVDQGRLCVYHHQIGGGTLQDWVDQINSNTSITISRKAGQFTMPMVTGPVRSIIAQDWDMVIVHQASASSINSGTFFPSLPNLVSLYRQYCTNQNLKFGYQVPWAWSSTYGTAPFGVDRYNAIISTIRSVIETMRDDYNFNFDAIIPAGTAIQNARQVVSPVIDGGDELTRDGFHLQYGTGRYIAAATFFQVVLSPATNKPMLGSSARHALTPSEALEPTSIAVDGTNYEVCQRAAFLACVDNWHINNPS